VNFRVEDPLWRRIVDDARVILSVHDLDGSIRSVSSAVCDTLGYRAEALVGASAVTLCHPDDRGQILQIAEGLAGGDDGWSVTVRVRHLDGSWRWLESNVRCQREPGDDQVRRIFAVSRDVTNAITVQQVLRANERQMDTLLTSERQTRNELRDAEELFRSAFENAPIGMALLDLEGRTVRVNHALCELTGRSDTHLLGRLLEDVTHPVDRSADQEARAAMLAGAAQTMRRQERLLHADGHDVWVTVSVSLVRDESGAPRWFVSQAEDVTERKRTEATLTRLALQDGLTGLPNRAVLMDRLEHAIARTRREHGTVALLFVDLDRFKSVNDTLGHLIGDRLLMAVAERLVSELRPGDTAARLGGDEFVVLCQDVGGPQGASTVARRLGDALARPFDIDGYTVQISASIGVVLAGEDEDDPGSLLSDADSAMYAAKQRGRARHEMFDVGLRERSGERRRIERDLRTAIDGDELRAHYQTIVDLTTGRVQGVEALVRWLHPQLGLLSPADFLGSAEDSGLIVEVDSWVLRHACTWAASCSPTGRADDQLNLSVNLSARQLVRPGLARRVADALDASGLAPDHLALELTESSLLDATPSALSELGAVKDLGVTLGLDDFGTGYSSLTYLRRFPVDFLKIDRSFTAGLGTHREDTAIVKATIALAHALHLRATAEGVEHAEQAERLRMLGCDGAQGFHFARPQPAESVEFALR